MRLSRIPLLLGALALTAGAVGCSEKRSSQGGGGDGGSGGTGGTPIGETTIYDLQDPAKHAAEGTQVVLKGVVVTAVIERRQTDGTFAPQQFFVQDPRGGRYSGIYVFNGSDGSPIVTTPAIGDVVDLAGKYVEYFERSQIEVLTLVNKGPGTLPTPETVDPEGIATTGADMEAYEGVLVQVTDAVTTDPKPLDANGQDFNYFRVNAQGRTEGGVLVGNQRATGYIRVAGDLFSSIVGVLDFDFAEAKVLPRSPTDITFADGTHPGTVDAGEKTVYQLQNPAADGYPRPPANVTVKDVVVTASAGNRIWVQEADGGPWSGIQVRLPSGVDAPAVGDLVDVSGLYTEYFDAAQIQDAAIEVTGTGTVPAPAIVTPAAIRTGSADAEQWEGVLLQVSAVQNVQDPVNGTDGTDRGDFRAGPTGGTAGVIVGHNWRTNYQGTVGDQFRSIVGVMDFSFDESRLEPRGNDDITLADGTHPQAASLTIAQIQNPAAAGHPNPNTAVKLENVVVTAASSKGFWVQDPTANAWAGIYVFRKAGNTQTIPAVGKRVTVEGVYVEYNDLSEIELATVTVTGDATVPAPLVLTPDQLTGTSAETYEGMLVEVRGVANTEDPVVGTDGQDRGDFRVQTTGGTGGVIVGRSIGHDYNGAVGDRFDSIVGVVDYSFGAFRVQPRGNADITLAGGTHPGLPDATVTIFDVQDETSPAHPAPGSTVTLENVVVTAVRMNGSGQLTGVYVSEPEGGAYSGIYAFKVASSVFPAVSVGDVVTVVGEYTEYKAANAPANARTLSEIIVDSVALVSAGTGTVQPTVLLPTQIAANNALAEAYENCLVQVADVTVNDASGTSFFKAQRTVDATLDDEIYIGKLFYTGLSLTLNQHLATVTGILDDFSGTYRLHPRGATDLVSE